VRTGDRLAAALARIREMRSRDLPAIRIGEDRPFNQALLDWYELRAALLCAEAVALSALNRTESRGAQQREDFPESLPAFERNQTMALAGGELAAGWQAVPRIAYTIEEKRAAVV